MYISNRSSILLSIFKQNKILETHEKIAQDPTVQGQEHKFNCLSKEFVKINLFIIKLNN